MKKRVSIKDLAKACSVSIGTVSRALSNDHKINILTRNKVQKMAEELGYVPNSLARSLSKKTSNIVGLIIPDITNPFFAEVAKYIELYAREKGISIFLCNTNLSIDNEIKYIEKLYSYQVNGIIIVPVSLDIDHILKRFSPQNNIVFLSYIPQSLTDSNYVTTDDYKIMNIALKYLYNIGHRNFSYLGGEENLCSNMLRRKAFLDILCNYNLEPIIINNLEKNYLNKYDIVEEIKNDLLNANKLPTSIITYNDNLALNTIQAIEEIGLKVPRDISVIGIDNISISRFHNIELTTVSQQNMEIGKICAEVIINKITNKSQEYEKHILEPKLIVRKSTRSLIV